MAETVQAAASSDAVRHQAATPTAAAVAALGVVYGDIGTSPLYALKEAAKAAGGRRGAAPEAVLGVLSVILWALILVVSVKYAILILRADNRGEGGIVAMLALLERGAKPSAAGGQRPGGRAGRRCPALRRRRDHAGDFGP